MVDEIKGRGKSKERCEGGSAEHFLIRWLYGLLPNPMSGGPILFMRRRGKMTGFPVGGEKFSKGGCNV